MRQSIDLPEEDWGALQQLAIRTQSVSARGSKIGQASWRKLLARLARDTAAQKLLVDHYATKANPPRHKLPSATILRPPEPVTKSLAWVSVNGETIRIFQPEKRDDFGAAVKGMGYIWQEPHWERTVAAAVVAQRVAETCHRLVAGGFCVVPPTRAIAERVIAGDFEREVTRRILVIEQGEYRGWFAIWWARDEDFFERAKRITASRYYKPYIVVPPEHYAEVLDFAERHRFTLDPAARRRVAEAETMLASALLLDLPTDSLESDADVIPVLDAIDATIDPELADDPL